MTRDAAPRGTGILLLISLGFSLITGEVLVRRFLPRPGFRAFPAADYGVLVPDSIRGYRYASNLRRHIITPDYQYEFKTNSLGMRDAAVEAQLPAGPRILVIGDSYTQGLGVDASQAWPKRLQELVPLSRVYDTGVSGYSLRQMRQTAELFVPRVHPHVIVAGLFGHAYNRITNPFVIVPGGASPVSQSMAARLRLVDGGFLEPAFEHRLPREVTFWIDRHWYLAGHLIHAASAVWGSVRAARDTGATSPLPGAIAPMLDELSRLQSFADTRRIPLVTLLINFQEQDGSFSTNQRTIDSLVIEFAAQHRLCVVNPLAALEAAAAVRPILRFPGDRHWSPTAHAVAAHDLLIQLRRAGSEACAAAANVLAKAR